MRYAQNLSTVMHRVLNTPIATLKLARNLTGSVRCQRLKRTAGADSSLKRLQLLPHLCLVLGLISTTSITQANAANYSIDHLKLYAHTRILNYKEFQCFNRIITKESRWSYTARNGSHYGLGQMRSKHYGTLDPFRQIDASIKYITKRYGSPCVALAHHEKRNWF